MLVFKAVNLTEMSLVFFLFFHYHFFLDEVKPVDKTFKNTLKFEVEYMHSKLRLLLTDVTSYS